mmetsp:Transcript_20108/g.45532  ORF Transcript_20108/g.45532 Transcript_20108/m.45532 type:complete len:782 (+) Transcript_20108:193-2538(+)
MRSCCLLSTAPRLNPVAPIAAEQSLLAFLGAAGVGRDEVGNHAWVGESGRVPEVRWGHGLAERRHLAQDPPHDLPAPRLGEARRGVVERVRRRERAHLASDEPLELLGEFWVVWVALEVVRQRHEHVHGLALDRVVHPDGGGLGHLGVQHHGGLHLGRADVVPRDDHHVVHAARDPVVTVLVAARAVPGEVVALEGEVGLLEALRVAPDAPQRRGPRGLDRQQPLGGAVRLGELFSLRVQQGGLHPEARQRGRAGLEPPPFGGHRTDHVRARLGLPPRVHDGAPRVAHHLEVPPPGLGVDGLADGPEQLEGLAGGAGHEVLAVRHEAADQGGRRVEVGHRVLVHHLPQPRRGGVGRHALEHHLGCAVKQRTVGYVRVPRNPSAVGRAEEDIAGLEVKGVLEGRRRPEQVAARCVEDALGLPSGAAGVEDEGGVLGVDPLGLALGRVLRRERLVPPHVPALHHLHGRRAIGGPEPLQHDGGLDRFSAHLLDQGQRRVDDSLERYQLPPAHHAVLRDHHSGPAVDDARGERLLAEPPKHHRVHGPEAGARQHRHAVFRDVGHEHRHAVPLLDTLGPQRLGQLVHLAQELRVRVRIRLVRRALAHAVPLGVQGHLVPQPGGHLAVEAVERQVGGRPLEPLDEHLALGPVEVVLQAFGGVQRSPAPLKPGGDLRPERRRVLDALLVHCIVLLDALEVGAAPLRRPSVGQVVDGLDVVARDGGAANRGVPHGNGIKPVVRALKTLDSSHGNGQPKKANHPWCDSVFVGSRLQTLQGVLSRCHPAAD